MYNFLARAFLGRKVARLNQGNPEAILGMTAEDVVFRFPGRNSWASQFRPTELTRCFRPTHIGRAEFETFLRRYVASGIQMEIEDLMVSGPPWKARMAAKVHVWSLAPDGADRYRNRAVIWIDTRWGRIRRQEDFEDTESAAAFDRLLESLGPSQTMA
ncbi:MAG: nuclear transport factor 2 family protein [Tetrasphaera sp.]